jgi:hypothetical protein
MTRDFNKQRRDDSRPSFRKSSPNGYGDTRSSRPARPRLNRETVDRAWESGAQPNHADYSARTTGGQSSYRGNGNGRYPNRDNQHNQHHQHTAYGNDGNRRENYRENSRHAERPFDKEARSFESNRRNFDGPHSHSHDSHNFDKPRSRGYRDTEADGARSHSHDSHDFDKPRSRGYRDTEADGGRSHSHDSHNFDKPRSRGYRDAQAEEPRNRYRSRDQRQGYGPRNGESDFRTGRGKAWEQRDSHEGRPRDFHPNTHRSSRPFEQHNSRQSAQNSFKNSRPHRSYQQAFEGDYERFDSDEELDKSRAPRAQNNFKPPRARNFDAEELHVTRLPDGRVIKGPRPAQRKNAQFWTEVSAEKDELLDHLHVSALAEDDQEILASDATHVTGIGAQLSTEEQLNATANTAQSTPTRMPHRSRSAAANAIARSKKSSARSSRSTGPKPSQRGFKWPTP